jgi:hypothetical protein
MAKKAIKKEDSDISLENVLSAVDKKNIDWWETLTLAQQKKFSSWLYMRYVSNVGGNADLARYYLIAVNERVNKKFSEIKNHNKLQYLLMTTASPSMGKQFHQFINPPKIGKSNRKKINLLTKLFPMVNDQELEVLAETNSDKDIEQYLISMGWPDKEIKAAFSNKNTDED